MNPLFIFLIMNPSLWWSMVFPEMFGWTKQDDKQDKKNKE